MSSSKQIILTCFVLVVFVLTSFGCGSDDGPAPEGSQKSSEPVEQTSKAPEPTRTSTLEAPGVSSQTVIDKADAVAVASSEKGAALPSKSVGSRQNAQNARNAPQAVPPTPEKVSEVAVAATAVAATPVAASGQSAVSKGSNTPVSATANSASGSQQTNRNDDRPLVNLTETSPSVVTEEMERATARVPQTSRHGCWGEFPDKDARRLCLAIDTAATAQIAKLRGDDIVQNEPSAVAHFELSQSAVTPPLVGHETRFRQAIRDGYNVFNLRQFNAPVELQGEQLSVPVPPVLESSNWDMFIELLNNNELMSPDDVLIEQWIQELDNGFVYERNSRYPITNDTLVFDLHQELRLRNSHIDVVIDSGASPFFDDPYRFIMRLSALHADPVHLRELDIVFVLDRTASMAQDERLTLAKELIGLTTSILESEGSSAVPLRIGLITFGDETESVLSVGEYERIR